MLKIIPLANIFQNPFSGRKRDYLAHGAGET